MTNCSRCGHNPVTHIWQHKKSGHTVGMCWNCKIDRRVAKVIQKATNWAMVKVTHEDPYPGVEVPVFAEVTP